MGAKVVLNLMLEEKILTIYVRSKFLIYTNKIKKKSKTTKKSQFNVVDSRQDVIATGLSTRGFGSIFQGLLTTAFISVYFYHDCFSFFSFFFSLSSYYLLLYFIFTFYCFLFQSLSFSLSDLSISLFVPFPLPHFLPFSLLLSLFSLCTFYQSIPF